MDVIKDMEADSGAKFEDLADKIGLLPNSKPHTTYRGYLKVRTRTALGSYGRAMNRSIGPS